jgi:hypothetical protein
MTKILNIVRRLRANLTALPQSWSRQLMVV